MKNLIIIIIALFSFNTTQAQLIASMTTKTEGGIMGEVEKFIPEVGFYEVGTDLMNETMIFKNIEISSESETTYIIDSKNSDENFEKFAAILISNSDLTLKVGHELSKIKNHVGRTKEEWFNTNFKGKHINRIELVINKVEFKTKEIKKNISWTDFSYEITINVYGIDDSVVQN